MTTHEYISTVMIILANIIGIVVNKSIVQDSKTITTRAKEVYDEIQKRIAFEPLLTKEGIKYRLIGAVVLNRGNINVVTFKSDLSVIVESNGEKYLLHYIEIN